MARVTFKYIKSNPDIQMYVQKSDDALRAIGYTEHSAAHVDKAAQTAYMLLMELGFPERDAELAQIAAYMHDIGNVVNRNDHAQSGAVMAFRLLDRMEMPAEEICTIISAIGNHDEATATPINAVSAALILADKTDVRRTRVRNPINRTFDIHDRVNYAVEESHFGFNEDKTAVVLKLKIDTSIASVMEYFEIFLDRMLLCKKAAEYLGTQFFLIVNDSKIL